MKSPEVTNVLVEKPKQEIEQRTHQCANCEIPLDSKDSYCSQCGQRAGKVNLTFGEFLRDVFSNYLGYDSQLVKSVVPFLFKPGKLTLAFNQGKRVAYVHPLRLYLVLSIFYFFALKVSYSTFVSRNADDFKSGSQKSIAAVKEELSENLNAQLRDSVTVDGELIPLADINQAVKASLEEEEIDKKKGELELSTIIEELAAISERSNEAIMDSLQVAPEYRTEFAHHMVNQTRKLSKNDIGFFVSFLMSNLPLMMIILLPLFALLLKVLYFRSRMRYMQHMIHALHLHAIAFLIYGIMFMVLISIGGSNAIFLTVFTLMTVYAFISFKRVYQQSYKKTFFKFLLVGMGYSFLILLGVIGELLISFLLY